MTPGPGDGGGPPRGVLPGDADEIRSQELQTGLHEPIPARDREQRDERRAVQEIQVVDLREVREPETAESGPVEAVRQPVQQGKKRVELDRESPVRGREQHVPADPTDLGDERRLLISRSRVLHDRVADSVLEVAVRQRDGAKIGLDEPGAGKLLGEPISLFRGRPITVSRSRYG
jgi:hypothetical protein